MRFARTRRYKHNTKHTLRIFIIHPHVDINPVRPSLASFLLVAVAKCQIPLLKLLMWAVTALSCHLPDDVLFSFAMLPNAVTSGIIPASSPYRINQLQPNQTDRGINRCHALSFFRRVAAQVDLCPSSRAAHVVEFVGCRPHGRTLTLALGCNPRASCATCRGIGRPGR